MGTLGVRHKKDGNSPFALTFRIRFFRKLLDLVLKNPPEPRRVTSDCFENL
jgi:hypothetical protein